MAYEGKSYKFWKDYVAYPNKLGLRLSIVELNVRAMP